MHPLPWNEAGPGNIMYMDSFFQLCDETLNLRYFSQMWSSRSEDVATEYNAWLASGALPSDFAD